MNGAKQCYSSGSEQLQWVEAIYSGLQLITVVMVGRLQWVAVGYSGKFRRSSL
jgi:hypothetical protein